MVRTLAALHPLYETNSIEELLSLLEARFRDLPPPLPVRPGARFPEKSRALVGFARAGLRAELGSKEDQERVKQWQKSKPIALKHHARQLGHALVQGINKEVAAIRGKSLKQPAQRRDRDFRGMDPSTLHGIHVTPRGPSKSGQTAGDVVKLTKRELPIRVRPRR